MSEQNKKVALKFIDTMRTGDAAGAATCLAPEVKTVTKGFSKIAGVRNYDQMVNAIGMFKWLIPDGLKTHIKTVTAEGDRVAVEFEGEATLSNGAPYNNQYVMLFTLRDGKITLLHEYCCTKLIDEVLFPLIASKGF